MKLVIHGRGFEISTEGTMSSISKEIDTLSKFTDQVSEKFASAEQKFVVETEEVPTQEEVASTSATDIPVIKPTKKTIDNLTLLFGTPWGRTPRSLAEVAKALEVNAVPDRIETISTTLIRLVKRGSLRRIQKEGKWVYFHIPAE